MTFEPGRPVHLPKDSTTFTRRLVDALVHIHTGGPPRSPGHRDQAARLDAHVHEESPRRNGVEVDPVLWSHIRRLWPSVERRAPTLIHDDYHPGNALWHRGRISAIVDWTVPGVGQAAADACYFRLDVSLVRGLDAGDEVLATYEAVMGEPVPDRPFWDLLAATRAVGIADAWYDSWVDFGIPGIALPLVEERLDAFVARALSEV
jgi:aminoglycoside phosphotransferase (APT) family kinase protein